MSSPDAGAAVRNAAGKRQSIQRCVIVIVESDLESMSVE